MELVQHIKKFWEPRMRHALLEHVDANGGAELSPMVAEALASHRTVIE
jgi:formate dehydrogenase subunit delta